MAILMLLSAGLSLLGSALMFWGAFGKRVGDHPHCAKCNFNLFGRNPDADACPECGHDLAARKAIRIGEKRRGKRRMAVGGAMVLVGSLMLVTNLAMTSASYRHAPTFYLIWVADNLSARQELVYRLQQNQLSPQAGSKIADRALDVQADSAKPWDDWWGQAIEAAYLAGHLNQQQLTRYARQAIKLELKARHKLQQGRPLVCMLELETGGNKNRVGPNTTVHVTASLTGLWVDGGPVELSHNYKQQAAKFEAKAAGSSRQSSHLPVFDASEKLGRRVIEVEGNLTLSPMIAGQSASVPVTLPLGRLRTEVEIVDHPTGNYLQAELSADEQIGRAGVWIGYLRHNKSRRALTVRIVEQPERVTVKCKIRFNSKTLPASPNGWRRSWGRVDLRSAQHHMTLEWPIDELLKLDPALTPSSRVDLIVWPDVKTAETGETVRTVWLGKWVFKDIPLDADAITVPGYGINDPLSESLVPAEVELLSLEEAERGIRDLK